MEFKSIGRNKKTFSARDLAPSFLVGRRVRRAHSAGAAANSQWWRIGRSTLICHINSSGLLNGPMLTFDSESDTTRLYTTMP